MALRFVSKPGQALPLPVGVTGARTLSFWDAPVCVVTNVVNPTAFLRKIVVFGLRLTTFVTRVLTEGFKMLQFDDVCNASLPSAVSPCPVGDAVAADWGGNGAFARHEAFQQRVVGVSEPHVVQFPRLVVVGVRLGESTCGLEG